MIKLKKSVMNKLKNFLLITLLGLVSMAGFTQDCVQEELIKLPGEWKAGMKGSTTNVSPESLLREKQTIQSIFEIFKAGYNPMGCQVSYGGIYGFNTASGKNWMANPYGLSMYFLNYVCEPDNSGKHYVNISTATTLDVRVNKFQMYNIEFFAAEFPDDHETGYIMVSKLPEYKNGYYFLETTADGNRKIKTYTWLIFYNDKLPFKHVTQREYLLRKKGDFKLKTDEINERVLTKKNRGDEFTPEDIEFYDGQREYYGKPIRLIEEMLRTKSVSELESPAVIQSRGDLNPLPTLVEISTPDSEILIKPNPDYYNKKLPKHAPQLFSINLTISHDDPVFEDIYEKVSKTVFSNVQKYRAMLCKSLGTEKP